MASTASLIDLYHSHTRELAPPEIAWQIPSASSAPGGNETYTRFCISLGDAIAIGWLRPSVLEAIVQYNDSLPASNKPFLVDKAGCADEVAFATHINSCGKIARSDALQRMLLYWRDHNIFPDKLKRWRGETLSAYYDGPPLRDADMHGSTAAVFNVEKSAAYVLGLHMDGVHLTIYQRDANNDVLVWVAKRGAEKRNFPSMLDNAVGGAIDSDQSCLGATIRESEEEAGLSAEYVTSRILAIPGYLRIGFLNPNGWLHQTRLFAYEICLGPLEDVRLRPDPGTGEVESFVLMKPDDIVKHLRHGDFTPASGMIMMDFLSRHGLLAHEPDSELLSTALQAQRKQQ